MDIARNKIQTVLGPIDPNKLGITLCHEHLFHKAWTCTFVPNSKSNRYSNLNNSIVTPSNLWYTTFHPYTHEDNLDFTGQPIVDAITDELKFFKQNGGSSIVEVTTHGSNSSKLAQMSSESGVNIVSNTGYYINGAYFNDTASTTKKSIEQLHDEMMNHILNGIDGIRPGVIGELASGWPIEPFERRVLLAAAEIQSNLNFPVIIHPGRNSEAPFEVMRVFTEAGGKCSRTVMSHLDRTFKSEELLEFAKTGTICELDLFGQETSYYELSDSFDMPSDAVRIELIKDLLNEGHSDRITISHDLHTKHRLMKYGGHGYSHILLNVVPKFLQREICQQDIDKILIHTPQRWLTL